MIAQYMNMRMDRTELNLKYKQIDEDEKTVKIATSNSQRL